MPPAPDIKFILERDGAGYKMWACRGHMRGCSRNKYRRRLVHCDDCVATDEKETLEALNARMQRGDA